MAESTESAQKRMAMIVVQNFTAGGKQYVTGDEVTPESVVDWPEGALERRVANKFITSKVVESASERVASDVADLKAASDKLRADSKQSKKE